MKIPRKAVAILMLASSLSLVGTSDTVVDLVSPPSDSCEPVVTSPACFTERRSLPPQIVRGSFTLSLQATQSILRDEIDGDSWSARLLKTWSYNRVDPNPDARALFASGEFKTHNRITINGVVSGGSLTIQQVVSETKVGKTNLKIKKLKGKVFNDGPCHVNGSKVSFPTSLSNGRIDYCFLAGIHRFAALANGGKRIIIGSRVELHVTVQGNQATIVPVVQTSRFPTSFLWTASAFSHCKAEPIGPVLEACNQWR
jgi:hypothetical protein